MPLVSLTAAPDPARWQALARARFARLTPQQRLFRQQLGLPVDRPVVMSGHQAAIWHAGILAKYLAAAALRDHASFGAGWVVVDQDPEDFTLLRVPVRRAGPDNVPMWSAVDVELAPAEIRQRLLAQTAPSNLPSVPAPSPDAPHPELSAPDGAAPHPMDTRAREALGRLARAWPALAGRLSAAEQVSAAVASLIVDDALTGAPLTPVFATRLAQTDFFAALVARMLEDPRACIGAYNEAVRANPDLGIAPLALPSVPAGPARRAHSATNGGAATASGLDPFELSDPLDAPPVSERPIELPLWAIDPDTGVRRRVHTQNVPIWPVPRALMLTAALRLGACDLFIHGTGGGATASIRDDHTPDAPTQSPDSPDRGYDRVTEQWLEGWLGPLDRDLAPSVVVSATMTLPLSTRPPIGPTEAARAAWRAHHAQHAPTMLGESGAGAVARALGRLATKRSSPRWVRRALFRRAHELRSEARAAHSERLAELRRAVGDTRRRAMEDAVLRDRTWSIALFAPDELAVLRAAIDERLGFTPSAGDSTSTGDQR
jgi:hypothetical protein